MCWINSLGHLTSGGPPAWGVGQWLTSPHSEQKVLGRTNRLLSLIRHGSYWKRRVQQFFYCWMCIRYRDNVSTEPMPRNDKGTFTEPFPSNDKGIFTKPLPSNDKGTSTEPLPSNDRGIHARRRQRDLINYSIFSKYKSRLKGYSVTICYTGPHIWYGVLWIF
jgi:hypothetical protein